MRAGSRRWLLLGLSVLLPAAGIAYLGAVSYRDDRGLVAARLDEQHRSARAVAASMTREIDAALDAVATNLPPGARPSADGLGRIARHPLAAHPFRIARSGRLVYPAEHPLRAPGPDPTADRFLDTVPRICPERGFESCVDAMRAGRRRQSQLFEARRREAACAGERPCRSGDRNLTEAQRLYGQLASFDDTGPAAVLGLARLAVAAGRADEAAARYRLLGERFGGRADEDGVPYALLADLGAAEAGGTAAARLAIYRQLLDQTYRAPTPVLELAADRLHDGLAALALPAAERAQLAGLDARLAAAFRERTEAAALAPRAEVLARSAAPEARGLPVGGGGQTVVFRRESAGDVVGLTLDTPALLAAAGRAQVDLAALAEGARPAIVGSDAGRDDDTRTLASAGFGPVLPHLTLELVNDRSQPDPLDEIVRSRGRRHLAITGGLAFLLLIGLWATMRGAARERELARLKSDFVSTVSHELKTPLTSIRMFGEMLQQNVAGSDREREGRYHQIIVKESERLGLLIANLLDYSQIEKGTRRYQQQPVGAAELAEESVTTFDRLREARIPPVHLAVDPALADAAITVDREVVVGALLNLLGNAAKYGGEAGPIEVAVAAREQRVVLSVRDHGPGIPKSEHARIFREFYRTPEAYRSGKEGTGLGLALVKRHVEAQGGTVEVDSDRGRGATFLLSFPRSS
ncbi:MAG TPA: HAMP domain-containing sensor histidine kinase [Kofleriaceae bacterium]|nr:HAMP domain-containing sensor histidine kinase [Kofleriaceae bacterium]